jgi:hypothetical protein
MAFQQNPLGAAVAVDANVTVLGHALEELAP